MTKSSSKHVYGIVEEFREYISTLCGLRVEDVRVDDFNRSGDLGSEFGLITTDSYHVAVME